MPLGESHAVPDQEPTGAHASVQSAGYIGPAPQFPAQAERGRRILSAAEIERMLTPRERAQRPLLEAADRIQILVDEREYGGFASLALEHDPPAVVLFWKGPLPQPMDRLVDELRSSVRVVVRDAPYSLDELLEEARRIAGLDRASVGVKIWGVGPLNDCSGLSVVVDRATDLARAEREIRSAMKLEFSFGDPAMPA